MSDRDDLLLVRPGIRHVDWCDWALEAIAEFAVQSRENQQASDEGAQGGRARVVAESATSGEPAPPVECPHVARVFQLISGGIGLMNHSEAQQTILRWWNAVRPELERSLSAPCPTCDSLREKVEALVDALRPFGRASDSHRRGAGSYAEPSDSIRVTLANCDRAAALLAEHDKEQGKVKE